MVDKAYPKKLGDPMLIGFGDIFVFWMVREMQRMRDGTPVDHTLQFPLWESAGSFPHSLPSTSEYCNHCRWVSLFPMVTGGQPIQKG